MCHSPRNILCCGKGDGTIVLFDERSMRSVSRVSTKERRFQGKVNVHRTFQAHPGSVTSINISGDMLVTCGESKKIRRRQLDASVVEGFAKKNAHLGGTGTYHSDNLCKVYDVRMLRQGMPIQFTYNSAPAHAAFLSNTEDADVYSGENNSTLVAVTNTSTLVVHDVREDFSLAEMQPLQQHIPAEVRCVGVSPSTQMVAVGDDAGGLHVFTRHDATQSGTVAPRSCAFAAGETLETPPTHPPAPILTIPPQSLPWYLLDGGVPEEVMHFERTDRSEGAIYTLNRPPLVPYSPLQLLSAVPQGIGSATHKPRPARCIHPLLLESTKVDEQGGGIGYIDMGAVKSQRNVEFETKGSGLLFGKDKGKAYVEADPRVRSNERNSGMIDPDKYQRMELDGEMVYIDLATGTRIDRPPRHLRRIVLQKNTYGMSTFDLSKYNNTDLSGLEHSDEVSEKLAVVEELNSRVVVVVAIVLFLVVVIVVVVICYPITHFTHFTHLLFVVICCSLSFNLSSQSLLLLSLYSTLS
jgi:hypothetical protein